MKIKAWELTINIINDGYDEPIESMCLEIDDINDCIAIIELFTNHGVLFANDVYYQFILE